MSYVAQVSLPQSNYRDVGFQSRQVIDIDIKMVVTEYQTKILGDEQGKQFVAVFPDGVSITIQQGNGVTAHAVNLSQYQLLPCVHFEEYVSNSVIAIFYMRGSKPAQQKKYIREPFRAKARKIFCITDTFQTLEGVDDKT